MNCGTVLEKGVAEELEFLVIDRGPSLRCGEGCEDQGQVAKADLGEVVLDEIGSDKMGPKSMADGGDHQAKFGKDGRHVIDDNLLGRKDAGVWFGGRAIRARVDRLKEAGFLGPILQCDVWNVLGRILKALVRVSYRSYRRLGEQILHKEVRVVVVAWLPH